jgi:hypothetical protein
MAQHLQPLDPGFQFRHFVRNQATGLPGPLHRLQFPLDTLYQAMRIVVHPY